MTYLRNGGESWEYIALLICQTSIKSENVIFGLFDYFVCGWNEPDAASMNGLLQPNLKKAIKRLNEVAEVSTKIVDLKLKSVKAYNGGNHGN